MQGLGTDVMSLILQHLPIQAVTQLAQTNRLINKLIADTKYFERLAMKMIALTKIPLNFCENCQLLHTQHLSACTNCKKRELRQRGFVLAFD